MTSRERVLKVLNFEMPDRLPKDLSGMRSTGISAFAYPKLVKLLGLPLRLPRIYDNVQMLALPDIDVLKAIGCDVVTIDNGVTNAFDESEKWQDYDFNGRLPSRVRDSSIYQIQKDGTITYSMFKMPPSSYVFDMEHGGQPLNFTEDVPIEDLCQLKKNLHASELRDEDIKKITEHCKQVREKTDLAVFFNNTAFIPDISIAAHGGLGILPVLCLTKPDYVAELHEICIEHTIKNVRMLLPEIHCYIDILLIAADDWGTQNSLIASPDVYRALFQPYFRRLNDECHKIAPQIKTFLHSCGAIYDIIDLIIETGFDVINPIQWPAGGHSYKEWKDKCRSRISMWGGGVNAQSTLPLGTVEEVEREVTEVVSYLGEGGGFIFSNIHNILAEITPEKIVAMYQAAERVEN